MLRAKTTIAYAGILIAMTLATTGCQAAAVPSPSPSSPPVVTDSPSPSASASPKPSLSPSAVPVVPSVLGPNGFGKLKLGMTQGQAAASGMLKPFKATTAAGCSVNTQLKAASGHSAGASGTVLISKEHGVVVIDAFGSVHTPEGIKIGSTSAAMLKAYPTWTNVEDENPHADGRGYGKVAGNSNAVYRIATSKGKVVELTLQLKTQNCYE